MIGTIISTTILRDGPQGPRPEVAAPSSSVGKSYDSRQTAALLPTVTPVETPAPVPQQQDVQGQGQETSRLVDDIRQAAERANRYFKSVDTHLEFTVGEQTGRVVIRVVNSETQEVVRQIPPEKLVRLDDITTQLRGLLFETRG
jgi:flagellar protein FlaG